MTLRDLEAEVKAAGYEGDERLYKRLSELVGMPEVSALLKIEGEGQKRNIPPGIGPIVAEFLRRLDEMPIKRGAIPRTLELFLSGALEQSGLTELRNVGLGLTPGQAEGFSGVVEKLDRLLMLQELRTDALITEEQARELLGGLSPRKRVEPVRVGRFVRWKRSDVLAYIAGL